MSVRHAMLALLSEGPKYGMQLRDEFEARTDEVWPLNVGQVYTTLQRLKRDGLIAAAPGDGGEDDGTGTQKCYRITRRSTVRLATRCTRRADFEFKTSLGGSPKVTPACC
jgi:DNA-binding PadR family transcriptional regulator